MEATPENVEETGSFWMTAGRMTQENHVNNVTGLSEFGRKPL